MEQLTNLTERASAFATDIYGKLCVSHMLLHTGPDAGSLQGNPQSGDLKELIKPVLDFGAWYIQNPKAAATGAVGSLIGFVAVWLGTRGVYVNPQAAESEVFTEAIHNGPTGGASSDPKVRAAAIRAGREAAQSNAAWRVASPILYLTAGAVFGLAGRILGERL